MRKDLLDRIVINPKVMTGKPVIKGTRIPVELILKKLAQSIDINVILKNFPRLKPVDIRAAIMYAESLVENTEILQLSTS